MQGDNPYVTPSVDPSLIQEAEEQDGPITFSKKELKIVAGGVFFASLAGIPIAMLHSLLLPTNGQTADELPAPAPIQQKTAPVPKSENIFESDDMERPAPDFSKYWDMPEGSYDLATQAQPASAAGASPQEEMNGKGR